MYLYVAPGRLLGVVICGAQRGAPLRRCGSALILHRCASPRAALGTFVLCCTYDSRHVKIPNIFE